MIPAPEPGLYRVSNDTYHSWDAVNASLLRELHAYPPAQFHYDRYHPKEQTEAQKFGSVLHTMLLEPEELDARYVRSRPINLQRTEDKVYWAELQAESLANGKLAIRDKHYDQAAAMRRGVWADRTIRALLEDPSAQREVSIVWTDPGTGLPCKIRPDLLVRRGSTRMCLDVKSTHSAEYEAFRRAVKDHRYYIAAPWYLRGLQAFAPGDWIFAWLAVDKDAPHLPAVYQPGARTLDFGAREGERILRLYQHCRDHDTWPGYNAGGQARVLELPPYMLRETEDVQKADADPNNMEIDF